MGYQYDLDANRINYTTLDSIEAAKIKWIPINDYTKEHLREKYTTVYCTGDSKDIYIKNIPVNVPDDLRNYYTALIRWLETSNKRPDTITVDEMGKVANKYNDLPCNMKAFNIKAGMKALALFDIADIYIMYRTNIDGLFMVIWKREPNSIYICNGGIYNEHWTENLISDVSGKSSYRKV